MWNIRTAIDWRSRQHSNISEEIIWAITLGCLCDMHGNIILLQKFSQIEREEKNPPYTRNCTFVLFILFREWVFSSLKFGLCCFVGFFLVAELLSLCISDKQLWHVSEYLLLSEYLPLSHVFCTFAPWKHQIEVSPPVLLILDFRYIRYKVVFFFLWIPNMSAINHKYSSS